MIRSIITAHQLPITNHPLDLNAIQAVSDQLRAISIAIVQYEV
jgi:hypothetical protein